MKPLSLAFWVVLAATGLGGAALVSQRLETQRLRNELAAARGDEQERVSLQAENRRLAAQRPADTELEQLRADRAALGRLRGEIEALRSAADRPAPQVQPTTPPRAARPEALQANTAKNVGQLTPRAALETALWAAGGGDLAALGATLSFDPVARAKAEALFARLPAASRANYATPEKLIALFIAKEVPPRVAILDVSGGENDARLNLLLQPAEGSARQTALRLRREADAWKFIVPPQAVDRYAAMLQAPAEK